MVTCRTLFPNEIDHLKAHYLRLEPADRELRFFRRVSDRFIEQHCAEIDWRQAWVVGCFIDGVLRGAAELHLDQAYRPTHGEVAVSVETAWQDEGIGTELLRRVLVVARNRLVRTLSIVCRLDNRPMQRVARKFADDLRFCHGEVNVDIAVPYPSLFSLYDEACSNGLSLMAAWDRAFASPRAVSP